MGEITDYERTKHHAKQAEGITEAEWETEQEEASSEPEIAKYTMKDSVFTALFREKKYLIQLYRTLHPEDIETTEDDLRNITIKNVLTDGIYNDLGFTAGDKLLILVEAQASWSMNIIIRALMYLVQSYHEYFEGKKVELYRSKKVHLPKPELYVIFTGKRKEQPKEVLLSEEFFDGEECALEVKVNMIYGEEAWEAANAGDREEKDIISQYIIFTKVYNEQVKKYRRTRNAVMETIRICRDWNVLKEFLESREKEVVSIMMALFDEKRIVALYIENRVREGIEEGLKEAVQEAVQEMEKRAQEEVKKHVQEMEEHAQEVERRAAAEMEKKVAAEVEKKVAEAAKEAAKENAEKAARATRKTAEELLKTEKLSIEEIAACIPELSSEEIRGIQKTLTHAG